MGRRKKLTLVEQEIESILRQVARGEELKEVRIDSEGEPLAVFENKIVVFAKWLSAGERSFVHSAAADVGLYHYSSGTGAERCIQASREPPEDVVLDAKEWIEPLKPQKQFRKPINTWRYRDDESPPVHPKRHVVDGLLRESPSRRGASSKVDKKQHEFVDTLDGLWTVAELLKGEAEIAVDIEAENQRSYDGLCCLIQISTRTVDYVIDAIVLHDDIGEILGPIFSDENILKVFHSCEGLDIPALHRDFEIYVVNVFDTQLAASCLCHSRPSLIDTLRRLNINVGGRHAVLKAKYQRWEKWLDRPLDADALEYARLDATFLLDLKDKLLDLLQNPCGPAARAAFDDGDEDDDDDETKALGDAEEEDLDWGDDPDETTGGPVPLGDEESDAVRHAWCLSQRASLKLWRPRPPPGVLFKQDKTFRRERRQLDQVQRKCFEDLFAWRDHVARSLDEIPNRIASSDVLLALARHKPISVDLLGRAFFPVPPRLRIRGDDVVRIIQSALASSVDDDDAAADGCGPAGRRERRRRRRCEGDESDVVHENLPLNQSSGSKIDELHTAVVLYAEYCGPPRDVQK